MALRTLARFRNPDITSDINHRLRDLVTKGVFSGGQVSPVASLLEIDVQPFASIGADGLVTLLEGSSERLSVGIGTQWVLLHAEYQANDAAIAELEVLTEAQYNALSAAAKAARAKLAKLDVGAGSVEVTVDDISYLESDFTDPVDRSAFRGTVTTVTALPDYSNPPTGLSQFNRDGDHYLVSDERLFYGWDATGTAQWRPIISSAGEAALNAHRDNDDDGTVPPDLFEAQHITVKENDAFDAGSASQVKYPGDGFEFNAANPLMDAKFPMALNSRVTIVTSGAVTSVQLMDTVFVGNGGLGTASWSLTLLDSYTSRRLVSPNDGAPIGILGIFDSTNTFQINPSTDADAFGFVVNPWIRMDFSQTGDVSFNGTVGIHYGTRTSAGDQYIGAAMIPTPFMLAEEMQVPIKDFTGGMSGLTDKNVKGAFNYIDSKFVAFNRNVLTVGPTGSDANFTGSSQAAIQNAVDAATDGTTIIVLPGAYAFSSAVSITGRHNLCFRGVVPFSNTSSKTALPDFSVTGANQTLFDCTDCSNIVLKDLAFNEERAAVGAALLDFDQGQEHPGVTIERCLFYGTNNNGGTISITGHEDGVHGVKITGCVFDMEDKVSPRIKLTNVLDYRITGNSFSVNTLSHTAGAATGTMVEIGYSGTVTLGASGWITDNVVEGEINASFLNATIPTSDSSPYRGSSLIVEGNRIFNPSLASTSACFEVAAFQSSVSPGSTINIDKNQIIWGKVVAAAASTATCILKVGALKPGVLQVTNNKWETEGLAFNDFGAASGTILGESVVSGNWFMTKLNTSNSMWAASSARVIWDNNFWYQQGDDANVSLLVPFPITMSNSRFERRRGTSGSSWTEMEFQGDYTIIENCVFDRDDPNTLNAGARSMVKFNTASHSSIIGCTFLGSSTVFDVWAASGPRLDGSTHCTVTNNHFRDMIAAIGTASDCHHLVFSNNTLDRVCSMGIEGDYSVCSNNTLDCKNHPYLPATLRQISANNCSYGTFIGNTIYDSGSAITSAQNESSILTGPSCTIKGNTINNISFNVAGIRPGTGSIVEGNIITNFGAGINGAASPVVGIHAESKGRIEILGNRIENVGSATDPGQGIRLKSCSDCIVSHNNIRDLSLYTSDDTAIGVWLETNTDDTIMVGNRIEAAWTGISIYGSRTRISNCIIDNVVRGIVGVTSYNWTSVSHCFIILGDNTRFTDNDDDGVAVHLSGAAEGEFDHNYIRGSFTLTAPGGTNGYRPLAYVQGTSISHNTLLGGTDYGVGLIAVGTGAAISFNKIGNINGLGAGTQPDGETCGLLVTGGSRAHIHGNTSTNIGYDIAGYRGMAFRLRNADYATFVGNSIVPEAGMSAINIEATCDELVLSLNQWVGLAVTDNGTNTLSANNNP